MNLFGRIDNLFDKNPAIAPGGNGFPTNPVYFDTVGMTWRMGARLKFCVTRQRGEVSRGWDD